MKIAKHVLGEFGAFQDIRCVMDTLLIMCSVIKKLLSYRNYKRVVYAASESKFQQPKSSANREQFDTVRSLFAVRCAR